MENLKDNQRSDFELYVLNIGKEKRFDIKEIEEILDLKRQLYEKFKGQFEIWNEFQKEIKSLKDTIGYNECKKYLAWHIAIGSTPTKELIEKLDFEENSIKQFLKNFLDKLSQ